MTNRIARFLTGVATGAALTASIHDWHWWPMTVFLILMGLVTSDIRDQGE